MSRGAIEEIVSSRVLELCDRELTHVRDEVHPLYREALALLVQEYACTRSSYEFSRKFMIGMGPGGLEELPPTDEYLDEIAQRHHRDMRTIREKALFVDYLFGRYDDSLTAHRVDRLGERMYEDHEEDLYRMGY